MRPIVTLTSTESPVLREKTKNVKNPLDPEIQALLPEMITIMRKAEGIGLAAPQIGIPLRICVTEVDGSVKYFINPKITSASKEKIFYEEGCLSVPGKFLPIERSESITIRYVDEKGVERKERPRDLQAICLQHELDHLDGILIVDRYKNQKTTHAYAS
ncbi:MAG: peptide deformylase [Candidatus Moraniibacteriota bacterium]